MRLRSIFPLLVLTTLALPNALANVGGSVVDPDEDPVWVRYEILGDGNCNPGGEGCHAVLYIEAGARVLGKSYCVGVDDGRPILLTCSSHSLAVNFVLP